MPSSSEFNDMLNAAVQAGGVILVGILLAGLLAYSISYGQGKAARRSLQFAAFVVMLALLIPAITGVATYVAYRSTTAFMDNAEKADGVVVRLVEQRMTEGGYGYAAVIAFTPAGGRKLEFRDTREICNPPCKKVGDTVTVLYNAEDTSEARVETTASNWIWVGVLGLLTIVFLLLATWGIWHAYRTERYTLIFGKRPVPANQPESVG